MRDISNENIYPSHDDVHFFAKEGCDFFRKYFDQFMTKIDSISDKNDDYDEELEQVLSEAYKNAKKIN